MSDELKPVGADGQDAGTDTVVTENQSGTEINNGVDSQTVVELLEAQDKALAAAETKIVSLKRKLKSGDYGDEPQDEDDLRAQITALQEKVEKLTSSKDEDSDLKELQAQRKRVNELTESLKAKNAISSALAGNNQDKFVPEEDLAKRYSKADLAIYQRVADRKGLKLNEYLKTLK
jgi:Mg2+ and Co2+ transporter CorA